MRAISRKQSAIRGFFRFGLLLIVYCSLLSCSLPTLEATECTDARDSVKEFYSWYFANDAENRHKSPEMFDKYVAPAIRPTTNGDVDPFVLTSDFPKAFRVGECKVIEPGKRVKFELLLFWKDDKRSEQRSIHVDVDNVDGKWLIRDVTQ